MYQNGVSFYENPVAFYENPSPQLRVPKQLSKQLPLISATDLTNPPPIQVLHKVDRHKLPANRMAVRNME